MKILPYNLETKFDTTTDEYVFMYKSMEKSEVVFIRGDKEIALELFGQVCECKDIIYVADNMNITTELINEMRKKIGEEKKRFIFIGKNRIPSGVKGMAIVEIRSNMRSNIFREDGIEIEMLGPDCNGLTRMCLRYK